MACLLPLALVLVCTSQFAVHFLPHRPTDTDAIMNDSAEDQHHLCVCCQPIILLRLLFSSLQCCKQPQKTAKNRENKPAAPADHTDDIAGPFNVHRPNSINSGDNTACDAVDVSCSEDEVRGALQSNEPIFQRDQVLKKSFLHHGSYRRNQPYNGSNGSRFGLDCEVSVLSSSAEGYKSDTKSNDEEVDGDQDDVTLVGSAHSSLSDFTGLNSCNSLSDFNKMVDTHMDFQQLRQQVCNESGSDQDYSKSKRRLTSKSSRVTIYSQNLGSILENRSNASFSRSVISEVTRRKTMAEDAKPYCRYSIKGPIKPGELLIG